MAEGSTSDRSIEIHQDTLGSAIVSGDGNKVVIYHYHLAQAVPGSHPTASRTLGANPYRGLAAFQVADAEVYFGREVQVDRLWNRLRDIQEQTAPVKTRLLPILGASGSGKSSLARAGLLPELARRSLPGYRQSQVAVMTPGATPLESLSVVLARIATQDLTPVEKAQEFERVLRQVNDQNAHNSTGYQGLRRIANALPGIEASPLIVLVDQFEEVYSLCKDPSERTAFIENLLDAASSPTGSVSVLITLRSDFLGETQRHPKLDQLIGSDQSVIVPAMTTEELRRAIAEPAKRVGHPLEEAMVDLLIKDTEGREGALPLLQFALTRIWEGLEENRSPAETLKTIGGVGGALAGEAQRIHQSLDAKGQDIARRVFMGLVQLGDGTRDTRKRASVTSLVAAKDDEQQVRQVLDRFSAPGARLITLSAVEGKEIAEVTHEALFEHWQTLHNWLKDHRPFITWKERLRVTMQQWEVSDRDPAVLLRGRPLDEAEDWLQKQEVDLSQVEQSYIQAGLEERDRLQKAEQDRQQREYDLLKKFVSTAQVKTKLALTAAGLAIAALTVVGFSFWQQQQSQKTIEAVFLGTDPNEILGTLPQLHEQANNFKRSVDQLPDTADAQTAINYYQKHQQAINRLFAYYRSILTASYQLQQTIESQPEKFPSHVKEKIKKEISVPAEDSLAQMIYKYRIPELKSYLKQREFGNRKPGSKTIDFENRYTKGALQSTYAILERGSGAGADLNRNGLIDTQEEASQMPCQTLREIERLWRESTDNRCGWLGEESPYSDADCALDRDKNMKADSVENTLTTLVIGIPNEAINRIEQSVKRDCGVTPGSRF